MLDLPLWAWAPLIGTIYGVIGFFVRDAFPFSAYSMYSSTALRPEAALPAFFADGEDARVIDFIAFHGMDPEGLEWKHYPCAHHWMVYEAHRWFGEHPADEGTEEGPVTVSWGFRVFSLDDDGRMEVRYDALLEGTARRR